MIRQVIAVITEQELKAAIAECLGERDPDAHTCYKLASYFTIRNELFGNPEQLSDPVGKSDNLYSHDADVVTYSSESEFGQLINGMDSKQAWGIIEELMAAIYAENKPLYRLVIRRLQE